MEHNSALNGQEVEPEVPQMSEIPSEEHVSQETASMESLLEEQGF